MPTTTIRLEDELKARINAAAAQAGKTAHAFILDSLAQTVEQVELDNAFHAVAEERWARIRATSQTVDWNDAKAYLVARTQGERPRKPTPGTLGK